MYRFKNISLEPVFAKYDTRDFNTLSDNTLIELCTELNIIPEFMIDVVNTPGAADGYTFVTSVTQMGNFDKYATVRKIMKTFTYNVFVEQTYWRPSDVEKANKFRLAKRLKEIQSNKHNELYQLFQDIGLGFAELKPGMSIELDCPPRWVNEYFLKSPMHRMFSMENRILIQVEDLDAQVDLSAKSEELMKATQQKEEALILAEAQAREKKLTDVDQLNYRQLQEKAKLNGYPKVVGATTEQLKAFLQGNK